MNAKQTKFGYGDRVNVIGTAIGDPKGTGVVEGKQGTGRFIVRFDATNLVRLVDIRYGSVRMEKL